LKPLQTAGPSDGPEGEIKQSFEGFGNGVLHDKQSKRQND
jgi:hypothetical protein